MLVAGSGLIIRLRKDTVGSNPTRPTKAFSRFSSFVATSTIPSRPHIGYGRSSAQSGPTDCAIVLFARLHAAPMQPVEFLAVLKSLPA